MLVVPFVNVLVRLWAASPVRFFGVSAGASRLDLGVDEAQGIGTVVASRSRSASNTVADCEDFIKPEKNGGFVSKSFGLSYAFGIAGTGGTLSSPAP